jgi:hypothetical protein
MQRDNLEIRIATRKPWKNSTKKIINDMNHMKTGTQKAKENSKSQRKKNLEKVNEKKDARRDALVARVLVFIPRARNSSRKLRAYMDVPGKLNWLIYIYTHTHTHTQIVPYERRSAIIHNERVSSTYSERRNQSCVSPFPQRTTDRMKSIR